MVDQEVRNEFNAAVSAVRKNPDDLDNWDQIEILSEELNCADEVASLYKETLAQELPKELALTLGERAANYMEEWFGDDPSAAQDVLFRILDIDPEADWAFQRLTVVFSVAEQWDDMLRLYDRALTAAKGDGGSEERRIQLLEEAAQVAKDVANMPDKAIGYLQQLVALKASDPQLESSLERLLERHERWAELIALWESQLDGQTADEREKSRLRIASCWLDNLRDPGRALDAVRPLLAEAIDDAPACELLERIITDADTSAAIRSNALDLLRLHYESTGRPREIVRVLEAAIEIAQTAESMPLREEAGDRLAGLDDDLAALNHYGALLALDPAMAGIQDKMEQLARRSGNFAKYADCIAEAAQSCEDIPRKVTLLAETARIRLDMLEDEDGAIRYYQEALALEGLAPEEEHRVSRRLSELLARAERDGERLEVLERLARTDPNPASRRNVIGEAARLAENLQEVERALTLWKSRIDADEDDLFALDAMIALLEHDRRWESLIEMLMLRIGKTRSEIQRRADRVRIAAIYDRELQTPEKAIEAWLEVARESGETAETADALADLYTRTGQWDALTEVLERASSSERSRVTDWLVRLADAYREHLGVPERATSGYSYALAIEPNNESARSGMTALLDREDCRAEAADTLAMAYRRTDDWAGFLQLVEPRLADADSVDARLSILREAADIQEQRIDDSAGAFHSLARALPLAPKDRGLAAHILKLAEHTDNWDEAATALGRAAEALAAPSDADADTVGSTPSASADLYESARLRAACGEILSQRLGREEDAHTAYCAVIAVDPSNRAAADAVVSLGAKHGHWRDVANALVGYARGANTIAEEHLRDSESSATASGAFDELTTAMEEALANAQSAADIASDAEINAGSNGDSSASNSNGAAELSPRLCFRLYQALARWHRDHRDDAEASKTAFRRALSFAGVSDAERAQSLRELAALERTEPGAALYQTLRGLSEVAPDELDVVREAAEVAVTQLKDDSTAQSEALSALLARSTTAWRKSLATTATNGEGGGDGEGDEAAEGHVFWAVERMVDQYLAREEAQGAVDLLAEHARLPFANDVRRSMRHRAASIAADVLKDSAVAMQMYQAILSQEPEDIEAIDALAAIYEREEKVAEQLSLRTHQLSLENEAERRIALRLEIARLVGHIEAHGGRLESLLANLDDEPGHEPSVVAVSELLGGRGEHARLAEILDQQAQRLHERGGDSAAASLWMQVAEIAETHTDENERAIQCYRRVVDLVPNPGALRALARLYMEREQPAQAVPWFENLLAGAPTEERGVIVRQLAEAHLAAAHSDRAIIALERYLDGDIKAPELRAMLTDLYRQAESWEPLARHLTRSLTVIDDRDAIIEYAREAAEVYTERVGAPDRAIPALEKALALLPEDRALRMQLAVGLRIAGRLDEARELLETLIKEFGRRRSAERAALHVETARVYKAQGDDAKALSEMEVASKMDVGNVRIQKQLAELARQAGKLAKAERTYRALLLVVRRQPPGDDVSAVGASEVLYELHKLAAEQGQEDQAQELLETALETAIASDAEVHRLRRSLLSHNEPEVLLRALKMRLEASDSAHSQAMLLAEIAEVLDSEFGRTEEALEAIMDGLKKHPLQGELHERARAMAKRCDKSAVYIDTVRTLADNLRRKEDPPLVAQQLLRAGEALEQDVGDLEEALKLYQRVESLGEHTAEAYFAIARVCGALGKTDEQARVLEAMLALASAKEPSSAQIDALYRLAEIFISSEDRRQQGIDLLERAFAAEPRYAQAGVSLKLAAESEPDNDRVMRLYERVARNANDGVMLLDFLARRAERADAAPEQIREAVDVAVANGQADRAEALLSRAIDAARDSDEGIGAAVWAVLALAETRMATGEFAAARDLLFDASEYAEAEQIESLALSLAARARNGEDSDRALSAELYEFLRERSPSARHVWEPLVALYRDMGDGDKLQHVIAATLPTLVEPEERNALRMQHAQYLVENLERYSDAVEILRDVMLDDPERADAAALLEDILRRQGDEEALVDFLWQRFDDAKERGVAESIVDAATRLAALLEQSGSQDVLSVYRTALELVPEEITLVRAVLERLGPDADQRERAELLERLIGIESPERALELTLELCAAYEQLGDIEGVQRVLESGYQANAGNDELRGRLEEFYRQNERWQPLAELMVVDAERLAEAAGASDNSTAVVERLRAAAAVYRDTLSDPGAAAGVLRRALKITPSDGNLVAELAASLTAAGDMPAATSVIGESLTEELSDSDRIDLLLLRSDLYLALESEAEAVADLEGAYEIDGDRIRPQLIEVMERRRQSSQELGDVDAERAAVMKLSELLSAAGEQARTRDLLMAWVERQPQDRDPLYALLEMDKAAENWDGVMALSARLVEFESGEAQVKMALELAEAAEKSERPAEAVAGLELVHQAQPDSGDIRDRLRDMYELSGQHRQLAAVLLADGDHAEDEEVRYQAYVRAAELLLHSLGDIEAATEPARKARELRPQEHAGTVLLVDILTMGGQTDEAIAFLEEAIAGHRRRSPELGMLQQRMARIASVLGDRDNQLAWLKKAFDVDRKNGEIAAELAQLATEVGDYDLALKPLRAITLMDNPGPITRPMALLWEAKIEHARGNRAKAELWAKKALREDPAYAEAQEFLSEIS